MKKLLIFCILFINFISFSQSFSLDGYRFVYINKPIYEGGQIDIYGLEEEYSSFFREMRITSISDNQYDKEYAQHSGKESDTKSVTQNLTHAHTI